MSGVFTADPRVVPEARRIDHISFDEMLEMTANGCPKPAMRSVEFARTWGVRLHVRSAFTWEPGTWVQEEDPSMEQAIVSAVVHDTSEAKVTVSGVPDQPGIAARLFRLLADRDVNVDMIVQNVSDHGVTDISFTVPTEDLAVAEEVTAGARRRDRRHRGERRRGHRPGQPRRRRHEVEPRRGRHASSRSLADAGHQHRDDLHVGHPHLVHRRGAPRSSMPCSSSTGAFGLG